MIHSHSNTRAKSYLALPEIRKPSNSDIPVLQTPKSSSRHRTQLSTLSLTNLHRLPELRYLNLYSPDLSARKSPIAFTDRSLPHLQPSTVSNSTCGKVRAYAANTHQGIVRTYNEDKAMIILNIKSSSANKPDKPWPECSFFGLYDGHGGKACSNFLRDNLHHYIINDPYFPENPKQAITRGFAKAEMEFIRMAKDIGEKSGSCAIVTLIVGKNCYIANVGDSRAVMSGNQGQQIYTLTNDHKPAEPSEQTRIQEAGGKIYYNSSGNDNSNNRIYRVFPGRLSVSRTIGDMDAKAIEMGGNPNVVIATPEIKSFKIRKDYDFIVMGCDGIFDVMTTKEVVSQVWSSNYKNEDMVPNACRNAVESIVLGSMRKGSTDNVTAMIIAFRNFEEWSKNALLRLETNSENRHNC